jgi:hypothetical protein
VKSKKSELTLTCGYIKALGEGAYKQNRASGSWRIPFPRNASYNEVLDKLKSEFNVVSSACFLCKFDGEKVNPKNFSVAKYVAGVTYKTAARIYICSRFVLFNILYKGKSIYIYIYIYTCPIPNEDN